MASSETLKEPFKKVFYNRQLVRAEMPLVHVLQYLRGALHARVSLMFLHNISKPSSLLHFHLCSSYSPHNLETFISGSS